MLCSVKVMAMRQNKNINPLSEKKKYTVEHLECDFLPERSERVEGVFKMNLESLVYEH